MVCAYILWVPSNDQSSALAKRALASCRNVGQPVEPYDGFDGTGGTVRPPEHLRGQSWPSWIKLYDDRLSPTQIACALGHIALWAHCMTVDQPIVVLEHDAVMLKPYRGHAYPNTIAHLGWASGRGPVWVPASRSSGDFQNWKFLGGAHGYALDPLAARRLFSLVLTRGIYAPLDLMTRLADIAFIPADGHVRVEPGRSIIDSDNGGLDYERHTEGRD